MKLNSSLQLKAGHRKQLKIIKNSNVERSTHLRMWHLNSDILISANSPKSALEVAKKYGKFSNGIYIWI